MEILPFIYIVLALVIAPLGYISVLGKWPFFILSLLFTPFVAILILILLPKRPKAVCMVPFKNFEVGQVYYYKIVKTNDGKIYVSLFNGFIEKISLYEFYEHFSEIKPIKEKKLKDFEKLKL